MKRLEFRKIGSIKLDNNKDYLIHLITWEFSGELDHCVILTTNSDEGVSVKYWYDNRLRYYPPYPNEIQPMFELLISDEYKNDLKMGLKSLLSLKIQELSVIDRLSRYNPVYLRELLNDIDIEVNSIISEIIKIKPNT